MTHRLRWRELRILSNSRLYKLAVWRGWVCSPSVHALPGVFGYCPWCARHCPHEVWFPCEGGLLVCCQCGLEQTHQRQRVIPPS